MKITALSAQRKDPNRINVFVDGKYSFSLETAQVVDLGIKVGKEYDASSIATLETEGQFGKLYSQALEYCLMRPHSGREVNDYLFKKTFARKTRSRQTGKLLERPGVHPSLVRRVYERLVERGYVDDNKFARYWVENRKQRQGISKRKLQMELKAKGVDQQIIADVLSESNRQDRQELQKIIEKKRDKYQDKNKLVRYLVAQGFSYQDIVLLVNEDGI